MACLRGGGAPAPPDERGDVALWFGQANTALLVELVHDRPYRASRLATHTLEGLRDLQFDTPHSIFLRLLVLVAIFDGLARGLAAPPRWRRDLRAQRTRIRRWSALHPERTWMVSWLDAAADLSRSGDPAKWAGLADAAPHAMIEALVADWLSRHCERHGLDDLTIRSRVRAAAAYRRWGVPTRARQLESEPLVVRAEPPQRVALRLEIAGLGGAHLAEHVLDALVQAAGAADGALIRQSTRGPLVCAHTSRGAAVGVAESLEGSGLSSGMVRFVLRTGEAMALDGPTGPCLCEPLCVGERVVGAAVLRSGSPAGFSAQQRRAVRSVAAQAASSMENEALLEELDARVQHRTRELEAADQARSRFLATMSHELRTPLNAILGYAQILQRPTSTELIRRDGLRAIEDSGRHLLALIEDLLDQARIESGRLELALGEVDLRALLDRVVQTFELTAGHKGIALELLADRVPRVVWADGKRLRQVLVNLVGNAVKFTDSGSVSLRVAPGAGGAVRFEVRDTGPGVDPDDLRRIFEPYEQVGTPSRRAAGTGLGLAISRQIVAEMGGELLAESEPGQGSSFRFSVVLESVRTPAPLPGPERIAVGYEGPRQRVLVADDALVNRLVLTDLLEPLGFEVVLARDGVEATRLAAEHAPDLVLMDLLMPVMSGLEAARAIRRLPGLESVPMAVVSSSAPRVAGALELFGAVIDKPIDAEALLDAVARLLSIQWQQITPRVATDWTPRNEAGHLEVRPAPTVLQDLRALAHRGNLGDLAKRARSLAEGDEGLEPFAARVCALADAFDDDGLMELLGDVSR